MEVFQVIRTENGGRVVVKKTGAWMQFDDNQIWMVGGRRVDGFTKAIDWARQLSPIVEIEGGRSVE